MFDKWIEEGYNYILTMKKYNHLTILYILLAVIGGGALLVAGSDRPVLWAIGCVLLPPFALAALRQVPRHHALLAAVGFAALCLLGAPTMGVGALLFMLWYGAAVILDQFTRTTPDLFATLLYGGSLFGGLSCAAFCWTVRDYYGVWDIRGVFTALENALLGAVEQLEQFYPQFLQGEELEQALSKLDMLRGSAEGFAYQWIALALTLVCLQYFLTLKAGQFLCRKCPHNITTLSLWMLSVPREITLAYMILYVISMFFMAGNYYYAINIAISLSGYLFVLTGIGWVDTKLHKQTAGLRNFVKLSLVLLAVVSENFLFGLSYTLLCVLGIFCSLSRQVIIRRKGNGDHE